MMGGCNDANDSYFNHHSPDDDPEDALKRFNQMSSGSMASPFSRQLTLKERAQQFSELVESSGWDLLRQLFRPDIKCRIRDIDEKEAFLYESIRAQVIQEIFSTPYRVIRKVQHDDLKHER